MADIKSVVAQTEATRAGEGTPKYVRQLRDGTLSFADFMLVAELEGLVKVANGGGVASTAITFAGAYDADGQDFGLTVPAGTAVMIIKCRVQLEAMIDDVDAEVLFMTSNTAIAGTTGTAVTVKNKRNDLPTGSSCTCYVAFDAAGGTDTSAGSKAYTFWRDKLEMGAAPAAAQSEGTTRPIMEWTAPIDGLPAIVVDSGSISGHVQGAGLSGFIDVEWIEMPSSWIKD